MRLIVSFRMKAMVMTGFGTPEVFELRGDSSKAKEELGWVPRISFEELVQEM